MELFHIYPTDKENRKFYSQFLNETKETYFQQTMEWANVIESLGKDQLIIISVLEKDRMVGALPVYIYNSPHGNVLNSIPYPGPLGGTVIKKTNKKRQEKIFKELIEGLNRLAKEKNISLATIISSPFWPDDNLYKKYFKPDFVLENYTLYINLTKEQNTSSHFRNNLKRMLKKANKAGLKVYESANINDINKWHKIHRTRHLSLDLEPIPKKLFLSARDYMIKDDKGKFLFVKTPKGVIVAGCLVLYHNTVMDVYMISGDKQAYRNGAVYLLVNHILHWAKEKGFHYFNWESSKPRGGGPYNFKMQWGSSEVPYYFFTKAYKSIDSIAKLGLGKAKKIYEWHYLLPYEVFDKKQDAA